MSIAFDLPASADDEKDAVRRDALLKAIEDKSARHIEIYNNARPPQFAPTVLQWHLQTEPWVFVVNRSGRIAAKFEGPAPGSEIAPTINSTLT